MVQLGETNGWENWKGTEPKDERYYLVDAVYLLLKKVNKNNMVHQLKPFIFIQNI